MAETLVKYAVRVASFPVWGLDLMHQLERDRTTLQALLQVNTVTEKGQRWTFCMYLHNRDVQEHFIELAGEAMNQALRLPEGP